MIDPSRQDVSRLMHDAVAQRRMAALAIDAAIALLAGIVVAFTMPSLCLLIVVAFLFKDAIPGGSPGKLWFKLKVIEAQTGKRCSIAASILRNLTLIPPVCVAEALILALSPETTRLGDRLAGTCVKDLIERPQTAGVNTTAANEPQTETGPLEVAARQILCVDADADEDAIEDAFWDFAERYSPDATRDFTDDEFYRCCRELSERYSFTGVRGLEIPPLPPEDASPEEKRAYLNAFVVAVNRARDMLLM